MTETAEEVTAPTKASSSAGAEQPDTKAGDEKTSEKGGATPAAAAGAKESATKPKPAPNLQERMEGLQGWLAEIERKQRRTTRLTTATALLAVIAAAAAIALSLTTRSDSATQDDINELKTQLDGVTQQVTQSTEGQIESLNATVEGFDGRLKALEKQQSQTTTDINTLRRQVNTAVAQANQAPADTGTTGGGGGGNQP